MEGISLFSANLSSHKGKERELSQGWHEFRGLETGNGSIMATWRRSVHEGIWQLLKKIDVIRVGIWSVNTFLFVSVHECVYSANTLWHRLEDAQTQRQILQKQHKNNPGYSAWLVAYYPWLYLTVLNKIFTWQQELYLIMNLCEFTVNCILCNQQSIS